MKIDVFAHILPLKYKEALVKKSKRVFTMKIADACPTITDVNLRFRVMDKYPDYAQVLTIVSPSLDNIVSPQDATYLSKIANDEMVELLVKYPDRFLSAAACLPTCDMDAAVKELDRAIKDLRFKAIQIYTSVNGKPLDSPEFMPLYEKMVSYNLPILLHPLRDETTADYPIEDKSKYAIFSLFGWPYETTAAMTRLVYSGVLQRYPDLKIITHHSGGMIPYYAQRVDIWEGINEMCLGTRYEPYLTKTHLDYYKMFYCDTAVYGSTPALMCCYAFFGADQMLFGTDMPYDNQYGYRSLRESIKSVEEMKIPDADKNKIFEDNARKLMRLPV